MFLSDLFRKFQHLNLTSFSKLPKECKKVIYDNDDIMHGPRIMQGDHQRSLYCIILDIKALGLSLLLATATK